MFDPRGEQGKTGRGQFGGAIRSRFASEVVRAPGSKGPRPIGTYFWTIRSLPILSLNYPAEPIEMLLIGL